MHCAAMHCRKGCSKIGVPGHDLFSLSDLQSGDKSLFSLVLQNIYAVGRHAQAVEGYNGPKLGVKFSTTIREMSERRKKREAEQIEIEAIQWAREQELLERRKKYEEKRRTAVLERMIAEDERALERRRRRGGRSDPRSLNADRDPENEATALFGMDKELQEAQEANYDVGLEVSVLDWLEATTGLPVDFFYESLRDGVILCQLINKIRPGMIPRIADPLANASPLMTNSVGLQARENVKNYLRACEALGVKKTELFVPSDLCDRQNLISVLNNLTAIARIANSTPAFTGPTFEKGKNYDEIIANLPAPPEPTQVAEPRKRPKLLKSFTERFSPTKIAELESHSAPSASGSNQDEKATPVAVASAESVRAAMEEKRKEIERLKEAKRALEEREAQRRQETSRMKEEERLEAERRAERLKEHQIEAEDRRKKYKEAVEKEKAAKEAELLRQEEEKRALEAKRKEAVRRAKMRQRIQDLVDSGVDETLAQSQVEAEFSESSIAAAQSHTNTNLAEATVESRSQLDAQPLEIPENTQPSVQTREEIAEAEERDRLAAAEKERQAAVEREEAVKAIAAAEELARLAAKEQQERSLAAEREQQRLAALEAELEARAAAERAAFQRAASEREAAKLAAIQEAAEQDRRRAAAEAERLKKAQAEEEEKLALRKQREEAVRKAKQRQQEEEDALTRQAESAALTNQQPQHENPPVAAFESRKNDADLIPLDDEALSVGSSAVTQRRQSRDGSPKLPESQEEPSLLSIGSAAPSTPLLPSRSRGPCPCAIL
eukprot:TRINITY_DN1223_c0_g1_i1.p1 TRINITY_DN1223_c0_g1~~TRINITY_DN1223_c0_g1_i1.p1  ORF type:complete len:782 (-),score=172.51 TRINITY_DN1223_c0_g1_i1:41-2386(-)